MPTVSERLVRGLSGVGCAILGSSLAWIVLKRHHGESELARMISEASAERGLEHGVTAVLLDFRGYDTLLEIGVLVAALVGIWGSREAIGSSPSPTTRRASGKPRRADDPSGLLGGLVRVLAPVGLMVAAYLGWAGSHAPGGAFQAGTLLASLLILLTLAHRLDPDAALAPSARAVSSLGLWVFIAVGLGTLAAGRSFLDYPVAWMKPLVWLIEAALTISIASILWIFFAESSEPEGGRS
jgi:multisubunit Na+/H+ antiporter MnhB subunit